MMHTNLRWPLVVAFIVGVLGVAALTFGQTSSTTGKEIGLPKHLRDGEEYELSIARLVQFGERLFSAKWKIQEGAGRPNVKGTANGPQLSDPSQALVLPRNFSRISGDSGKFRHPRLGKS